MIKQKVLVKNLNNYVGFYVAILQGNEKYVGRIKSFIVEKNELCYEIIHGNLSGVSYVCELHPEQLVWIYDDDTVIDALLE